MFRDDSHKNYEEEKTVAGITSWMDGVCAHTPPNWRIAYPLKKNLFWKKQCTDVSRYKNTVSHDEVSSTEIVNNVVRIFDALYMYKSREMSKQNALFENWTLMMEEEFSNSHIVLEW